MEGIHRQLVAEYSVATVPNVGTHRCNPPVRSVMDDMLRPSEAWFRAPDTNRHYGHLT